MSNTTLTAIDGLLAGHATDDRNHTGCTAILCPQGFTPGIAVPGFAPGCRETELMRPESQVDTVHGLLLAGGCLILGAVLALLLSKLSLGGVARLILRAALIAAIAVALLVIVVLVFALRSSKEERQETQKTELSKDNEALLAKGRSNLAQLRAMSARIRSAAIRGKANGICASADQILRALRDDPGDIPRVRTFFNYYLPTLGTLLTKYEYLERSRAPLEEMNVKFSDCLDQIQSAMDRQYANLFEDDLLDMTAEMQTMTAVCRRDGLLTDGSVETDGGIRLTL